MQPETGLKQDHNLKNILQNFNQKQPQQKQSHYQQQQQQQQQL